jgi:N-acetylmuramoyl-L-alanine amidase
VGYHVCLDPGHYSGIAGKRSPDGTYAEHEFNLDMARRLKSLLETQGIDVTLTRSRDENVTLQQRVKIANAIKNLDLFFSIHTNAAGNSGWYDAKGLIVYTSAAGDTAGRNIAAKKILARMKEAGVTIRGAGIAHSLLYVLRRTTAPAVLVEHGFHTNEKETALLKTDGYRQKLAVADARGICDFLGVTWKEPKKEETSMDYRTAVQSRFGLAEETMKYLEQYKFGPDLLRKLATQG